MRASMRRTRFRLLLCAMRMVSTVLQTVGYARVQTVTKVFVSIACACI